MNSDFNTDIFYKYNSNLTENVRDLNIKSIEDSNNFPLTSSLFTSSTPLDKGKDSLLSPITESSYLKKNVSKLEKLVRDSDFLPSEKSKDKEQPIISVATDIHTQTEKPQISSIDI